MNTPAKVRGSGLALFLGIAFAAIGCADGTDRGRQLAKLHNAEDPCMSCLLEGDPGACKDLCSIGDCPEACSDCLVEFHNLDFCAERDACPLDASCDYPTVDGDHFCYADRSCGSLVDDTYCMSYGECEHPCADCIALEGDAAKCDSICNAEPNPCIECLRESGGDWQPCVESCR